MLAQSLRMAGFSVIAVDCFGDQDTRQTAQVFALTASLVWTDLQTVVLTLQARYHVTHLIYGSGFERHPDSLVALQQHYTLLGNSAEVFRAVQDKQHFFQTLDKLHIAYPLVRFTPPQNGQWLQKPWQGEGGINIQPFEVGKSSPHNSYWQQFISGQTLSALFIANTSGVDVIGWHQQWTLAESFLFAGVMTEHKLPLSVQAKVTDWLQRLTQHYGLKGLNSADFILNETGCYLLEINPRPSASLQLYDKSIIVAHCQACLGIAGEIDYNGHFYRGYQILYASQTLRIDDKQWPDWTMDRPMPQTVIASGQPVCSIRACAENQQSLWQQLQQRRALIEGFLQTGTLSSCNTEQVLIN